MSLMSSMQFTIFSLLEIPSVTENHCNKNNVGDTVIPLGNFLLRYRLDE